jgi:hypothetical protein
MDAWRTGRVGFAQGGELAAGVVEVAEGFAAEGGRAATVGVGEEMVAGGGDHWLGARFRDAFGLVEGGGGRWRRAGRVRAGDSAVGGSWLVVKNEGPACAGLRWIWVYSYCSELGGGTMPGFENICSQC